MHASSPVPRRRCLLLDDLYFCFSDFKFDFLSSDSSKFNSVWTMVLFRIFLTKWDPIWQVYFRFASATFYIIHFNILNVPFQHYHVKCWTMFAKCWTRFNEMLNPVFEMLNMISQHLYMFSFAKIKLNTTHH